METGAAAEVLDETYGVIVYQDQVLLIAQKFAGYSLGEADVMRKAMGKKVRSIMKAEEERFIQGSLAKGYTTEQAQQIYNLIEPFAGYAFNKAHAVSYGIIAYQTAYLKANYPQEYMTAVMRMAGDHKRIAEAFSECVRLDIPVLPPDVNHSETNFSLEQPSDGRRAIRFGLACVKNVGEGIAEGIIEARAVGPFKTIDDFFERVNARHLSKRALESIVKAGAFDSLAERGALFASLDRMIAHGQRVQKQKESGQTSLFDLMGEADQPALQGPELEKVPEAPQQQKLGWEKELLGVYLSEHPFAQAAGELRQFLTCGIVELSADIAGRDVMIGGIVAGMRTLSTKDGRAFLAAEIEDMTGSVEITVWPETYEQTREMWQTGNIIIANVRVKARDDRLQIAVNKALLYGAEGFDPTTLLVVPTNSNGNGYRRNGNGNGAKAAEPAPPRETSMRIVLEETDDPDSDHDRLRALVNVIQEYAGEQPVRLSIRQRDGAEVELELPTARYCPELTQRLGDIVGSWGSILA